MAFPIRFSHILAIGLTAGVGYYMLGGTTMLSGEGPSAGGEPVRATDNRAQEEVLFAVRARDFTAQERANALTVRGRTVADAAVAVSAETGGRVVDVYVREGDEVAAGDALCRLDEATRRATLLQAEAQLAQAEVELEAAQSLSNSGFGAQNRVPALQAALNLAQAGLEQAQLDLERTQITAPVGGVVQLPLAEVGAQLAPGAVCATLLDTDPLVVTAQVSERDIAQLSIGMDVQTQLVTGETTNGELAFIGAEANPDTRTFQIDVHIANPEGTMRAGVTAEASIGLPASRGHLLPVSTLGLAEDGNVGVHTLDDDNRVAFNPVTIIGDERTGVWVTGLPEDVRVIVVGQDFVVTGQEVAVTMVEDGILQTSQAPGTLGTPDNEGAAQ
ncbi:MAG: efflux RND transporter periplasmic adaptor subunit [Pseudomonadota bacterium]